ncbi:helicase [Vulcanococcus limneticus]|uniref:helicase n=1 Tax=Vulcanococcus limneticus TaxID=2170428 RepID=UPI00398C0562
MLEARAHAQLKALLRLEGEPRWPHHLTLSRLVARSLRRGDQTLVRLAPGSDPSWLLGLLVPLALAEVPLALVVTPELRQRLLQVELPRLQAAGLQLPCWEGPTAPPPDRLWLLQHADLVAAWRQGLLADRQLVVPEAEALEPQLRRALGVSLDSGDWEALRRSLPAAAASLLALHERLSRRILARPCGPLQQVAIAPEEEAPLRQLLGLLTPLPDPWPQWLAAAGDGWASWAQVDPVLLQWQWLRQPLEPLAAMAGLWEQRGVVLLGQVVEGSGLGFRPQVEVRLADPPLQDPLPLFAPQGQALPNAPHYASHLLEQSRRLVLGQAGLTVVLLDDEGLRRGLASGLAAEFGSRVGHETTAPEANGVLCCSWSWWLEHQGRLPLPCQLVAATLPIASLEDPLTAARVQALRLQGRDWFRELLLPEALGRLQRAVAGLRRSGGRLAVLDGRLRRRGWGRQVLQALEPWVALQRLLPS